MAKRKNSALNLFESRNRRDEFSKRLEQALDLTKNGLDPAKISLVDSPFRGDHPAGQKNTSRPGRPDLNVVRNIFLQLSYLSVTLHEWAPASDKTTPLPRHLAALRSR